MLFARKASGPLSSLLKQFDAAVAQHKDADMRSFAVFLTEDRDATEAELKELAAREKISENVPLALVETVAGPPEYKLNKDAEVTVLLYAKGEVVRNYAFKAGALKESDVKAIVREITQILPSGEESQKDAEARKKAEEFKKKLEAARKKAKESAGENKQGK